MYKYKRVVFVLTIALLTCIAGGCGSRRQDVVSLTQAAEIEEENEVCIADSEEAHEGETVTEPCAEKANERIYVHVCGAVVSPGLVELEDECRAAAAIEAAGGFSEDADPNYVNLAAVLYDGQQLYVPTREETGDMAPFLNGTVESPCNQANGMVNLNTADVSTLCTLPGIGESKAADIITYREQHGAFSDIEEVMAVSGIGNATFEKIKNLITV